MFIFLMSSECVSSNNETSGVGEFHVARCAISYLTGITEMMQLGIANFSKVLWVVTSSEVQACQLVQTTDPCLPSLGNSGQNL